MVLKVWFFKQGSQPTECNKKKVKKRQKINSKNTNSWTPTADFYQLKIAIKISKGV